MVYDAGVVLGALGVVAICCKEATKRSQKLLHQKNAWASYSGLRLGESLENVRMQQMSRRRLVTARQTKVVQIQQDVRCGGRRT
jgi:hypothetical protein